MSDKIIIVICIIFLIAGCVRTEKNSSSLIPTPSPQGNQSAPPSDFSSLSEEQLRAGGVKYVSKDKSFSSYYPASWYLRETSVTDSRRQYGTVIQSWVISSLPLPEKEGGGVPYNSIRIEFEESISSINSLEALGECGMKSISCEMITLDGQEYRQSVSTLNTGDTSVVLETIKNKRFYRATALIRSGRDDMELYNTFKSMSQTFTIL